MKCNKCQVELPEESKFCLKCGEKIEEEVNKIDSLCYNYFKMGYLMGIITSIKNKETKSFFEDIRVKMPKFHELIQEADNLIIENFSKM